MGKLDKKKIITGQHISPELKARAQELRHNMTPTERRLWQHLRASRLEGFNFRRQQIIDPFIVDFYCHEVGVVVELDGGIHLKQEEYDQDRESHLIDFGLKVLRFNNSDVEKNMDTVLETILLACQEAKGT